MHETDAVKAVGVSAFSFLIPSPEQFLTKLAANPADAADFDSCSPGITRREHVEAVLTAVKATLSETAALKARVAATKAKLAALEAARKHQSIMKTQSTPTATTTAGQFGKISLTMTRAEFSKLSPDDKSRFSKDGGKLI